MPADGTLAAILPWWFRQPFGSLWSTILYLPVCAEVECWRSPRGRSGARCRASWGGSARRISSSPRLHHQLRRVEPELRSRLLDGLALVSRLNGAHQLQPGGELIDGPRRLRWLRWLGLLRHAGSMGRAVRTAPVIRRCIFHH